MGKFKVGDKVRRTVVDFAECVVGEIYTISALKEGFLLLEGKGFQGGYDPACFELVEDIVEETKFKIGDKVEIVAEGQCCDRYKEKASELELVNWKDGVVPTRGSEGYVVAISPYNIEDYGTLCAVQTNTGCYLMLEDGIAPVKNQKEKDIEEAKVELLKAQHELIAEIRNNVGNNVEDEVSVVQSYPQTFLKWSTYLTHLVRLADKAKAIASAQEKLDNLKRTV